MDTYYAKMALNILRKEGVTGLVKQSEKFLKQRTIGKGSKFKKAEFILKTNKNKISTIIYITRIQILIRRLV